MGATISWWSLERLDCYLHGQGYTIGHIFRVQYGIKKWLWGHFFNLVTRRYALPVHCFLEQRFVPFMTGYNRSVVINTPYFPWSISRWLGIPKMRMCGIIGSGMVIASRMQRRFFSYGSIFAHIPYICQFHLQRSEGRAQYPAGESFPAPTGPGDRPRLPLPGHWPALGRLRKFLTD